METISRKEFHVVSNHEIAEVRLQLSNKQKKLIALRTYQPGDIFADFTAGTISAKPTYLTVQVGNNKHITLQPEFLQYINHSCDPNVFFNTTTMQLIALKTIRVEEEVTFFYPSTEWKMAQAFKCYCGFMHCIGEIRGAFYLSSESIRQYQLTDFIKQQLVRKTARKTVRKKVA